MTLARPNKTAGRVVLGPRLLAHNYVRIVALSDGSGRIEIYDADTRAWVDAPETCSFSDVWGAASVNATTHALLLRSSGVPVAPGAFLAPARNRTPRPLS